MDDERKNAYRRLLYAAMLDFRGGPVSPYDRRWWLRPWRWPAIVRRYQAVAAKADWLHNLASYGASDFDRFDERYFWDEYERLVRRLPDFGLRDGMYRHAFERDGPFGPSDSEPDRRWGTVSPAVRAENGPAAVVGRPSVTD